MEEKGSFKFEMSCNLFISFATEIIILQYGRYLEWAYFVLLRYLSIYLPW